MMFYNNIDMRFKCLYKILILFLLIIPALSCRSDAAVDPKFKVVVLGASGGLNEQDLTSYLVAPENDNNYVALDAGTIYYGIKKAVELGSFKDIQVPDNSLLKFESYILRHHIKAYLISHAHLDHTSGLIINSVADSTKTIIGIPKTIEYIRDHIFNWEIWPNFGTEGAGHKINQYKYLRALPVKEIVIPETAMSVTSFVLSHGNDHYPSTAFLISSGVYSVLYFGDTGPDVVEKADNMMRVWEHVAPMVREKKLRAIFLESSFSNGRPDHMLYGHMTPKWMMHELNVLAKLANKDTPGQALKGLPVVVTHIKPTIRAGIDPKEEIRKELDELNNLGVDFIIPVQGQRYEF